MGCSEEDCVFDDDDSITLLEFYESLSSGDKSADKMRPTSVDVAAVPRNCILGALIRETTLASFNTLLDYPSFTYIGGSKQQWRKEAYGLEVNCIAAIMYEEYSLL